MKVPRSHQAMIFAPDAMLTGLHLVSEQEARACCLKVSVFADMPRASQAAKYLSRSDPLWDKSDRVFGDLCLHQMHRLLLLP